jgi:hypothetical protein
MKKINPPIHLAMSKFRSLFLKKEREGMLHFQTIKEMKLHKKIKPPTHFTMSKSRLKSKAVPKKKERERTLVNIPKPKKK